MNTLNDAALSLIENARCDLEKLRDEMVKRHKDESRAIDDRLISCRRDLEALVAMAKEIPSKFFDRYAAMFFGEISLDRYDEQRYGEHGFWSPLVEMPQGGRNELRPSFGRVNKAGKYRVILMVERVS